MVSYRLIFFFFLYRSLIISFLWCMFTLLQNGVLDANVCDRGCKRLRGRLQTFAGRVANVCVQNRKNRHGNPLSELGQVWTEEEHLQESFCGDSSYAFRPLVQAIVYAIVFPMKIYWFLRVRRGCNDIK